MEIEDSFGSVCLSGLGGISEEVDTVRSDDRARNHDWNHRLSKLRRQNQVYEHQENIKKLQENEKMMVQLWEHKVTAV